MEDLRAELRLLVQATRALIDYTKDPSPEGAVIIKSEPKQATQTSPAPAEVRPISAPIAAQEISPSAVEAPRVEAMGFKDLFASLGPDAERPAIKAPPKPAEPVKPTEPKGEAAKGPLSKAKIIEVPFEDRMKNQQELEEISKQARVCVKCRLCETRKSVVWGVGPAYAPLMLIGEGPGENEDRQGIPFVGAAGQLLTKIITATGFSREDAYIANCVKCRPPDNRNPDPDELSACWPYLHKQIELVSPKVIVALGRFAAQSVLSTQAPISKLRGVVKRYNNIPVIVTFHPAYLLRNPADKRLVWEDMQVVRKVYDEIVG